MKPKNVHRGVSQLPSGENDPNKPVLGVGKISRIHRTLRKEKSRRRSRSSRDRFSLFRKALQFFFILIGITFVAGLVWIIYTQRNKNAVAPTTTLAEDTFLVPHPAGAECIQIAKKFLAATTVAELSSTARLKHTQPEEALRALDELQKKMGPIERMDWAGAEETNGLSLETVLITYKTGQYRVAYLIPDDSQKWLVDLESFISHNNRPWDQITGKGSCKASVRVIFTPANYYNGLFANDREWSCVAMTSPDHEEKIFGYVPTKSNTELSLLSILLTRNPATAILEISRDAGMEPGQFEIKKVIAQGWVEADIDYDTRMLEKNQQTKKTTEPSPPPP
jgi:hypothetical protein